VSAPLGSNISINGKFCGVLLKDGEVDTFLINKIGEIAEETAEQLPEKIGSISNEKALELIQFVADRIDEIIAAYKQGKHGGNRQHARPNGIDHRGWYQRISRSCRPC
jgi:hypothetical protein